MVIHRGDGIVVTHHTRVVVYPQNVRVYYVRAKSGLPYEHVGHMNDGATPVFVGGASSMASAFEAVDTVREVLTALEQQYVVVSLVHEVVERGLSVAIGAEHGIEPLVACAVVLAPVMAEGERVGTVGVVGPTRMNYPYALAAVDVVSDRLGRRLEEG